MITVTQGLGTNQLPLRGFGDSYGHANSPVVLAWLTLEARPIWSDALEAIPSSGAPQDGFYTEIDQDGIWTENVGFAMGQNIKDGGYTRNDIFDPEPKPQVFPTKETVPT